MKKFTGLIAVSLICLAALLLLTAPAFPYPSYSALENTAEFGNLSQTNANLPQPDFNKAGCGPTALANSLLYLQNAHPGIYGTSLVLDPNNLAATAKMLVGNPIGTNYLNWTSTDGVYWNDYFKGTRNYIEHQAAGKTTYHGEAWAGTGFPGWVDVHSGYPTWDFLYGALQKSQAVMINWRDNAYSPIKKHYMSITGISFNDFNNNGIIDSGEGQITYIDPRDGGVHTTQLWQDTGQSGNPLMLSYANPDPINYPTWYTGNAQIVMAEAFGPVPLPSTVLLLGSGLLGLAGVGRRLRKS